jgi:hypothetical protein
LLQKNSWSYRLAQILKVFGVTSLLQDFNINIRLAFLYQPADETGKYGQ